MPANEKDKFYENLTICVEEDSNLSGKNVPVQLVAEDIVLIIWALKEFASGEIIRALAEVSEKATTEKVNKDKVIERIEQGFKDDEAKQKTLKKLIFKLEEAMEIATERDKNQAELGFNGN